MNTTLNSSTIIPFPKNGAASPDHAVAAPYQWFRLYNDVIYDPKVQRLNGETFKAWINILCLASKNGGLLPCVADLAYALRMTDQAAADLIQTLRRLNLLDVVADATYTPHNWNGRQFKSDTSAD